MKKEFDLKDIKGVAKEILAKIEKSKKDNSSSVLLMYGDLGAGKTTMTKNLAGLLGIKEKIVSPTFVIMKRYKTKHAKIKNLIHIDAYRLDSGEDLEKIGFRDWVLESDSLIIIEWPERVSSILNGKFMKMFLNHKNESTRLLEFK